MRLSRICLCGLLTLVCAEGPLRSAGEVPPDRLASIERFLAQKEVPLTSAVTRRHLVATTRGGAMSGWLDACTFLDGNEMRYEILAQGAYTVAAGGISMQWISAATKQQRAATCSFAGSDIVTCNQEGGGHFELRRSAANQTMPAPAMQPAAATIAPAGAEPVPAPN